MSNGRFRTIRAVSLLTILFCTGMDRCAFASGDKDPLETEFKRLAEVFSPTTPHNIKGKTWVVVERGPIATLDLKVALEGWVLDDGLKDIQVMDWLGEVHRLRKPLGNERRPELKPDKEGAIRWNPAEMDVSVAWKVREADYLAKGKGFIKAGFPDDKNGANAFGMAHVRFSLADHVVDSARHAYYASLLGDADHAKEIYHYGLTAFKKYADTYEGGLEKKTLYSTFVADRMASGLRYGVIYSGHDGTPRKELLAAWGKLEKIPHHKYVDEAKAMSKHYRDMIAEDALWAEPEPTAFAKLSTAQKTKYWMYHLRDLDVGQNSDPGYCDVFERYGRASRLNDDERRRPNAAAELKKIGLEAVPVLIEHLDDERPTRCKGHWRSYWPEGHYLLRYGDCCQQIIEGITGEKIFERKTAVSYPIHDGEGEKCKEKAEKWWKDHQSKAESGKP